MSTVTHPRHTCWSYDDHPSFDACAQEFLAAGLAAGEQVWLVAGSRPSATADWLSHAARSPRSDAIRVLSSEDAYPGDREINPEGQVAAYATATSDALDAGFTGLRIVADATALVRTESQRDAFARYEYLIGRHMRTAPMTAICAYDRGELGERAVAELACLHQASEPPGVSFHLHPGPTPATAVLDGELDAATEDLFAQALRRTDLQPAGGEILVDADGLRFVDHRSLIALQRYAEQQRSTAVVRTRFGAAARIADVLDMPHLRVEVTR
jgi:hypothetical protein